MSHDETSGMRGLKQIWKSLEARNNKNKHEIFEKHTSHYLNRCFQDWIK